MSGSVSASLVTSSSVNRKVQPPSLEHEPSTNTCVNLRKIHKDDMNAESTIVPPCNTTSSRLFSFQPMTFPTLCPWYRSPGPLPRNKVIYHPLHCQGSRFQGKGRCRRRWQRWTILRIFGASREIPHTARQQPTPRPHTLHRRQDGKLTARTRDINPVRLEWRDVVFGMGRPKGS